MLIIPLHSRQALKQFPKAKVQQITCCPGVKSLQVTWRNLFRVFFGGEGRKGSTMRTEIFCVRCGQIRRKSMTNKPGRFNVQKILVCWVVFCSGSFSNWKTNKNNWGIRLLFWGLSCKFKIWKSLGDKQRSPTKMFSKSCLLGARKSDNNL